METDDEGRSARSPDERRCEPTLGESALQSLEQVPVRQPASEASTYTSRRGPARTLVLEAVKQQGNWHPLTLMAVDPKLDSGIFFCEAIVTVFAFGVMLGWGCARKCWRATPRTTMMEDMRIDAEAQTSELGLIQELPTRTLRHARW